MNGYNNGKRRTARTTWTSDPQVAAIPFETQILCPTAYWDRPRRSAGIDLDELAKHLEDVVCSESRFWCEKTPRNVLHFRRILRCLGKRARLIQVVRDGRDVVCSVHPDDPNGRSQGYSSGVLMLDDRQLEIIGLWRKYAEKYPRYPDDFVLDFMSRFIPLGISTVPLEFYDRSTSSPIARGNWRNEHTIIQHPTINRWPSPTVYRKAFIGRDARRRSQSEAISRQRKGIFFRNFGGDFGRVDAAMRNGTESEFRSNDWVFDAIEQRYAPQRYWPTHADNYTSKPRTFERSRENFYRPTKHRSFREKAIGRMRLDRADALHYGHASLRSRVGSSVRQTIASVFRLGD